MNKFEQDVITRYQEKLASMEKAAISWGTVIDAVNSRNQVMDPLEGIIGRSPANSMSASVKRHIGDTIGQYFNGGVPDFMIGDISPIPALNGPTITADPKFKNRVSWLNGENDLLNHMHGSKVPEKEFNRILMSELGGHE